MCPYRILVKSLEILARRWIWIGDIAKLEINDSIKLHILSEWYFDRLFDIEADYQYILKLYQVFMKGTSL